MFGLSRQLLRGHVIEVIMMITLVIITILIITIAIIVNTASPSRPLRVMGRPPISIDEDRDQLTIRQTKNDDRLPGRLCLSAASDHWQERNKSF